MEKKERDGWGEREKESARERKGEMGSEREKRAREGVGREIKKEGGERNTQSKRD